MTDQQLFQSIRQTLPHRSAEIAFAEQSYKSGNVDSAKRRLSGMLGDEIRRIRRYDDTGRMASSVEVLHVARVKICRGNLMENWCRLSPQLKGYWVQSGKDMKWVDRGLKVVAALLTVPAIVLGGDYRSAKRMTSLIRIAVRPYAVAIDVMTSSAARKNLFKTMGALVDIGKAKTAQLIERARPLVKRAVGSGMNVARTTVRTLSSAVNTATRKAKGMFNRVLAGF